VKKLRRCAEDRYDFDHKDGAMWPMQIDKHGDLFGFCPAKATWDHEAVNKFRLLMLASESGCLNYVNGGLMDQPEWWVESLSWFLPRYRVLQFISRAKMILGDGSSKGAGGGRNSK
jgi:hypothetical protein